MKVATAAFIVVSLAACGAASGNSSDEAGAKTVAADPGAFELGINVSSIDYYSGTEPFLNLIYGSSWRMRDRKRGGGDEDVPPSSLDPKGWVKSVPAGYIVVRALAVPRSGGTFVCRYRGEGTLEVMGNAVSSVVASAGETRFLLADTSGNPQGATLSYSVKPTNYIRDVDCRDSRASPSETFTPEFTSALAGFRTIRFMKWQTATEGNWPVTWATRNKPGDADYQRSDGVPVELMVAAANRTGADIWVTMPWNADDQYVTKFAAYIRDNLAAGHQVYAEVSNEVWNSGYPVASQAEKEAKSEGLPSATGSGTGGNLERYAEKTMKVMAIWSTVFRGKEAALVRVASLQHVSPYFSDLLLNYRNLHQSIDALATAPYFGSEIRDSRSLDQVMAALPGEVASTVKLGRQQKAIARKYGLRYITYEAGQGVVLPNNVPLEQQIQRDPRMYGIYRQFIAAWRTEIGDRLNLFSLNGEIGQYGGWGLVQYLGQPLSQAPKMRAVKDSFAMGASASGRRAPTESPASTSR